MTVGDLRSRLESHIDRLPVLPTVVGRLMVLDRDRDGYFEEVLSLIEADPPFAARILSAANGATGRHLEPVTSIRAALLRLGSRGAANAITATSVARVFVPQDDWEKSLWRHSIHVASMMRAMVDLERRSRIHRDVAYAAGLLHDIGRLIIFQQAPDVLHQIVEGRWDSPQSLIAAERAVCGISHPELGARACRRWNLPEALVEVVGRHHHSVANPTGETDLLVAMARFADLAMFPSAMPGTPGREKGTVKALDTELVPYLPANMADLGPDAIRRLLIDATSRAEKAASAVGLG